MNTLVLPSPSAEDTEFSECWHGWTSLAKSIRSLRSLSAHTIRKGRTYLAQPTPRGAHYIGQRGHCVSGARACHSLDPASLSSLLSPPPHRIPFHPSFSPSPLLFLYFHIDRNCNVPLSFLATRVLPLFPFHSFLRRFAHPASSCISLLLNSHVSCSTLLSTFTCSLAIALALTTLCTPLPALFAAYAAEAQNKTLEDDLGSVPAELSTSNPDTKDTACSSTSSCSFSPCTPKRCSFHVGWAHPIHFPCLRRAPARVPL
ncbi:hypothetical protein B0H13DRAFT_2363615 [Mycena leptocephala]|nr:hypothetical protein B0H13DRAFT_2363615 [Mycena leptocephala]